jgi:hypothetical protein
MSAGYISNACPLLTLLLFPAVFVSCFAGSQGLSWLAVFAFGELALWAAVPWPARVATTIIHRNNSINRCHYTLLPPRIIA